MNQLEDLPTIKARNFKCFGEPEQGFEQIKPINVIIGRNNTGKSSLLDLVEYVVTGRCNVAESLWHQGKPAQIIFESPLTEVQVKSVFDEHSTDSNLSTRNSWEFGRQLVDTKIKWRLGGKQYEKIFDSIGDSPNGKRPLDKVSGRGEYLNALVNTKRNIFPGKIYRRIYAERNILPERDDPKNLEVLGSGAGTTNIIQNFINKEKLPSHLVERTLLEEHNIICRTDAEFSDIVCQQLENASWEVYLEEKSKGRIALSQSGSGLKTIIIVLVYLHLIPAFLKKGLSDFIFAFEELENNLHPALLRRLLNYLLKAAESQGCIFFLTTHSSVVIDLFSKNKNAQIVHVTHDGESAYCRAATTYIENKGILDDLDVRASDLLQSNGIVWVEGPSDRVYINRWIDLWSNGELSEGVHYQCIFYGGKLLSHLSSEDPEAVDDGISILRANRNAIVVIDSDKRSQQSKLNSTKKRISEEVEKNQGIAWITGGKEIENYIPAEAVAQLLNLAHIPQQVGRYDSFFEYLDNLKTNEGKLYLNKKSVLC